MWDVAHALWCGAPAAAATEKINYFVSVGATVTESIMHIAELLTHQGCSTNIQSLSLSHFSSHAEGNFCVFRVLRFGHGPVPHAPLLSIRSCGAAVIAPDIERNISRLIALLL